MATALLVGVAANAQENKNSDAVSPELVKEIVQQVKADKSLEWASKLKFYGDLRMRYDREDGERNGETADQKRDRLRLRARLNMDAKLDDEWMGSIQLSTGTSDPTSGNQTFGNGFEGKSFGLERAYLRYTPEELDKALKITAGKMGQPWIAVSDLIFDGSVNPEGIAAVGEVKLEGVTLYANGGFFQPQGTFNDNAKTSPTRLYSAQAAAKLALDDDFSFLFGVGTFIWDNLKGKEPRTGFWEQGSGCGINNGGAKYEVSTYEELELFAQIDANIGIPCAVFGQYVNNAKGDKDKNAYLVGVKAGKADKGKLEASYDYRCVGRDSVLSAYTEGSIWGGGTDGIGHRVQVKYGLTKAVQLGLTGFISKANESGTQEHASAFSGNYSRIQFDIAAKF